MRIFTTNCRCFSLSFSRLLQLSYSFELDSSCTIIPTKKSDFQLRFPWSHCVRIHRITNNSGIYITNFVLFNAAVISLSLRMHPKQHNNKTEKLNNSQQSSSYIINVSEDEKSLRNFFIRRGDFINHRKIFHIEPERNHHVEEWERAQNDQTIALEVVVDLFHIYNN